LPRATSDCPCFQFYLLASTVCITDFVLDKNYIYGRQSLEGSCSDIMCLADLATHWRVSMHCFYVLLHYGQMNCMYVFMYVWCYMHDVIIIHKDMMNGNGW